MTTKPAAARKDATSKSDTYEPAELAAKFGIPLSEAKTIIKRSGSSRRKLDAQMAARGV